MGERNIHAEIRSIVEDMGDPLMADLVGRTHSTYDKVAPVVKLMVRRGELRQKEDLVDHDWTYRKSANWVTYGYTT